MSIEGFKIPLGSEVAVADADFRGTVIARMEELDGTIAYEVKPIDPPNKRRAEAEWVEESRLVIVGESARKVLGLDDPKEKKKP